jgi:glycosyltransferase involved in cell wall biosynthesis
MVLTIQYGESADRVAHGRGGLIRRSFQLMLERSTYVTAISAPLLDLARAYGYQGPLTLIPNGVDIERWRPKDPRPLLARPTVISVSRLVRKNGIDTLLRAVALLTGEFPTIECRIIGDGPERERLGRLAADLGLARVVRFLGSLPHADVPRQLWESSVFARPSRSEGMGTSFVEAQAAGIPVVGTRVGGIPDIIRDEETGLLVDVDQPADLAAKIRGVLTDRSLAARLAREGLESVHERFDADEIARRYAAVFDSALGAPTP